MRKLALFSLAFACSVAAGQYLLPFEWYLPAGLCCLLPLLSLFFLKGKSRRIVTIFSLGLTLGLLYSGAYMYLVAAPAESLVGTEQTWEMTALDYAEETDYGGRIKVRLADGICAAYYASGEELFALQPGDRFSAVAEASSARYIRESTTNTFYAKGVYLLLYHRGEDALRLTGSSNSPLHWPARLCRLVQEKLQALYEGDEAAFRLAILTGERGELSDKLYVRLIETGMLHITAVSGLHCVFLLELIELFTGRRRNPLTVALALVLLLLFTLMVGAKPSVVRAYVTILLLLTAPLFGRESDPVTSMAAALLLILLGNPCAITSVGLQLSFAAVSGVLWLMPRVRGFLMKRQSKHRLLRALQQGVAAALSVTMGASFFTIPISAYYFGTVATITFLANVLLVGPASLIFGLGMVSLLLSFVSLPLAGVVSLGASALMRLLFWGLELLCRIPNHVLYLTNHYLVWWLLYLYGMLLVCLFVTRNKRSWICMAVGAICGLLLCMGLIRWEYRVGSFRAEVLDVGQGAATLLVSEGKTALVDCGSKNGIYDAGTIAAASLLGRGFTKLDVLILTHGHEDHISGLERLLAKIPVKEIRIPSMEEESVQRIAALAEQYGIQLTQITERTQYRFGKVNLILYPPREQAALDNEACLAVHLQRGEFDLLLTGDMPAAQEKDLVERYELSGVEAIVVSHHGSNYSSSKAYLQALQPDCAIISVGDNSYGHPGDETMQRLARVGATVYRTDRQGNVSIVVYE